MIDTLRLTAEDAIGLIERKEISSAELHSAYIAAAGERDGDLFRVPPTAGPEVSA